MKKGNKLRFNLEVLVVQPLFSECCVQGFENKKSHKSPKKYAFFAAQKVLHNFEHVGYYNIINGNFSNNLDKEEKSLNL